MDQWKQTFLSKLNQAQSQWIGQFDEALSTHFAPVFEEYRQFLTDNGFRLSVPLRESGRRSFKFELSENAYLLMILRATGVGELELRCESSVPGCDPAQSCSIAAVSEVTAEWVTQKVHGALDTFVDLLNNATPAAAEELVAV
jgi:hypothetical protein